MATVSRSRSAARSTSSRPVEPRELDDFAAFCGELTLENKERMVLHPFERRMLADYFAGATETLILISKKNGKTTLMAALALYHLVVTEDAECVIAAASRDQAQIMLRQARGFIRRSPDLQRLMAVKQREITSLVDEGRVRVLASDEDTADGVIPTLAIVDELHRHRSDALYGVFRDGLGPRDGRMLTISTAGDDDESPLGQMRAAAYGLPVFEREQSYRYARSADGGYVMHEWALEPDEDREDMAVVKRANPAPWQTVKRLRDRRDSPSMKPWQWARFACGVWLQGESRAVGPVEWGACAGAMEHPPEGAVVRLGLDVGWKIDTTALVAHWFDGDGVAHLSPARVLVPPEEQGVALRKDEVLGAAVEMREQFGADVIVLDPENDGEVIAQDLEELGFEVVAHSQKPQVMAQAAERFYAAVRERTVRHPRDPRLTRHVLNAVEKRTDDGRWRFVKETKQSRKVIDALIAAVMVHNVALDDESTTKEPMFAWA